MENAQSELEVLEEGMANIDTVCGCCPTGSTRN